MTKLIIQIPCLNEAATLPATLADLPARRPGIDVHRDAGRRRRVARRDSRRRARVRRRSRRSAAPEQRDWPLPSRRGIDASLKQGADFIVNTDADNQYAAARFRACSQPLLSGEADIVIGDRNIAELQPHVVAQASAPAAGELGRAAGVQHRSVPDTTSGFRAYTREAALRMTIVSEFSYTLGVDHPGRQEAHGDRARAGRDQPAHARVASASTASSRTSSDPAATIVRIYAMLRAAQGVHVHRVLTYLGREWRAVFASFIYLAFVESRHRTPSVADPVRRPDDRRASRCILIGLLADVISANQQAARGSRARVRSLELPRRHGEPSRRPRRRRPRGGALRREPRAPLERRILAEPPASRSSSRPTTKRQSSQKSSLPSRHAGPWHEIIVVDDGSTDGIAARASRPEPRSCGTRTTKGTARRSRSGIRTRHR